MCRRWRSAQPNTGSRTVTIPTLPAGIYYLFACADDTKLAIESSESNNCNAADTRITVGAIPIVLTYETTVDLVNSEVTFQVIFRGPRKFNRATTSYNSTSTPIRLFREVDSTLTVTRLPQRFELSGATSIERRFVTRVSMVCRPLVTDTGFSRFPVLNADGSVTHYLHIKDGLRHDGTSDQPLPASALRPTVRLSDDTALDDALTAMRRSRAHLAAAVAADGTTTGVATMADILKQLIGTSRA